MDKTLLNQITTIFKDVLQNENIELTESSSAKDVDGWESATHMMIITEIENQFDIEFELDELWGMKNIGDLIGILKSKI